MISLQNVNSNEIIVPLRKKQKHQECKMLMSLQAGRTFQTLMIFCVWDNLNWHAGNMRAESRANLLVWKWENLLKLGYGYREVHYIILLSQKERIRLVWKVLIQVLSMSMWVLHSQCLLWRFDNNMY